MSSNHVVVSWAFVLIKVYKKILIKCVDQCTQRTPSSIKTDELVSKLETFIASWRWQYVGSIVWVSNKIVCRVSSVSYSLSFESRQLCSSLSFCDWGNNSSIKVPGQIKSLNPYDNITESCGGTSCHNRELVSREADLLERRTKSVAINI